MTNQIEPLKERKITRFSSAILIIVSQIFVLGYLVVPYITTTFDKIFSPTSYRSDFARVIGYLRAVHFGDAKLFPTVISVLSVACLIAFSVLLIMKKLHPLTSLPLFAHVIFLAIRYMIAIADTTKFYADYYEVNDFSKIPGTASLIIILSAFAYAFEIIMTLIFALLVLYCFSKIKKKALSIILLVFLLIPICVFVFVLLFMTPIQALNAILSVIPLIADPHSIIQWADGIYYSVLTSSFFGMLLMYLGYAISGIFAVSPNKKAKRSKKASLEATPVIEEETTSELA